MKKLLVLIFIILCTAYAPSLSAQDFHCHKAWKKEYKSDKKQFKIHRKMFADKQHKAIRKYRKAMKKEYKSDLENYRHEYARKCYWY
ncbi:MAG: hypothetical protein V4649_05325 [Bacteroidota bacterium]